MTPKPAAASGSASAPPAPRPHSILTKLPAASDKKDLVFDKDILRFSRPRAPVATSAHLALPAAVLT